jgi:tRNA modification GTPase
MPVELPTVVACLTPPGAGAIAVLAVHGPRAWDVARHVFQPRSKDAVLSQDAAPGRFWLGRMGNEVADQVVLVLRRKAPAPWVEIHCHGGREVVRLLEETIVAQGVERCIWQEAEHWANPDSLQIEAAIRLARAPTTRTANILLDQFHGAFRRSIEAVRCAAEQGDAASAIRLLDDIADYRDLGRHLTTPWRVVVAGAPNVGKSSLINALAGYQRSIVAPTPGTTRDLVTILTAIDGWPVELADTAGLRADAEALEAEGIDRARRALQEADLILWVLDAAAPRILPEFESRRIRLIVNKIDLPAAWPVDTLPNAIGVSALTGAGIGGLCEALGSWLVPAPPPAGAAVPFCPALVRQVDDTRVLLASGDVARSYENVLRLLNPCVRESAAP